MIREEAIYVAVDLARDYVKTDSWMLRKKINLRVKINELCRKYNFIWLGGLLVKF